MSEGLFSSMKFDGVTREKGRSMRVKWLCPKSKSYELMVKLSIYFPVKIHVHLHLVEEYIIQPSIKTLDLIVLFLEIQKKWNNLYKIRTITERTNNIIKHPLGLSTLKVNKTDSLKAELLLAGITQLITVIISYKINNKNKILSIKSLIA